MRFLYLMPLAAILVGCASENTGINAGGGDAFVLEARSVTGRAAVNQGLAQAQGFCGGNGRLFVLTNSQVGSSSYRLEFRCIAMNNTLPVVVAAAPATATRAPAPRTARGRRAVATNTQDVPSSGSPLGYAAILPAMTAPPAQVFWSAASANLPPALPPVATTPLFAPAPGTMLAVPPLTGPRLPPADNSPLVALPRLDSMATAERLPVIQAAAPIGTTTANPAILTREALPPVGTLPLLQTPQPAQSWAQPAAQAVTPASLPTSLRAEPLPLIQVQPLPAAALPLSLPPPSFGSVVPSANPLPGASGSLPPIAGGSTRQVPLPGGNVSGFSSGSTGFSQGFR